LTAKVIVFEVAVNPRRRIVALAVAALLLFGGAARAMHPSARPMKTIVWCDGIDDEIAKARCAAVENKKTGDISPRYTRVWLHAIESSPTSRDVQRACRAGEGFAVTLLLLRPILRIARCSALQRCTDPD
jgi:hypothetical protein